MLLTPLERYEIELAIYQDELRHYQEALETMPQLIPWLHVPEPPVLIGTRRHWDMRKVVTGTRRKWK